MTTDKRIKIIMIVSLIVVMIISVSVCNDMLKNIGNTIPLTSDTPIGLYNGVMEVYSGQGNLKSITPQSTIGDDL